LRIKILIGIPLLLSFFVLAYFTLPWLFIFIGNQLEPNPPHPEITHGEFPFRLVYEINGQRQVIEDTLTCDFDLFGTDEGRGKYRKVRERLASGNEMLLC